MGHPKRQRRKYDTPFRPWDKTRISSERKLLNEYGLRRKRELWKAEAILRNFRRRARELLGTPNEAMEKALMEKLTKIGIQCGTLDEVLGISINDVLSRRLQTVIHKKGVSNGIWHARQMIVHGHVRIDGRRIKYPSYIVSVKDESSIKATKFVLPEPKEDTQKGPVSEDIKPAAKEDTKPAEKKEEKAAVATPKEDAKS